MDGSKFKAVNDRDRNFTSAKVQRRMEQIEASINRYMSALDMTDQQKAATEQTKSSNLKEKIAAQKSVWSNSRKSRSWCKLRQTNRSR